MKIEAGKIKSWVERIETLLAERAAINGDIKDIYVEVKSNEHDAKAIRKLIARRAADPADLAIQDDLLFAYTDAIAGKIRALDAISKGASTKEAAKAGGISTGSVSALASVQKSRNVNTDPAPETPSEGATPETPDRDGSALADIMCAVDAGKPCPNTCAREGRCVWAGEDSSVLSGRVPPSDEQEAPAARENNGCGPGLSTGCSGPSAVSAVPSPSGLAATVCRTVSPSIPRAVLTPSEQNKRASDPTVTPATSHLGACPSTPPQSDACSTEEAPPTPLVGAVGSLQGDRVAAPVLTPDVTTEIDLTPPPRLLEKRREIEKGGGGVTTRKSASCPDERAEGAA